VSQSPDIEITQPALETATALDLPFVGTLQAAR
jgi:hypothetical protein